MDEFQVKNPSDVKPRNIFNPHASVKAILGLINFNLVRHYKRILPESFIHGLSTEKLSLKIEAIL
jgi:hypothetical protein